MLHLTLQLANINKTHLFCYKLNTLYSITCESHHQVFIMPYDYRKYQPLEPFMMNTIQPRTFHKRRSPAKDEPKDKMQKREVNIFFFHYLKFNINNFIKYHKK